LSKDITPILDGWDYDADELQVRIIAGIDGRDKIQMRIDLGLFQMELDGRPDGVRPFGFESLLDYHQAKAAKKKGESYPIDSEACASLMREGVQYYHRYLALFHLERYDLVARDTTRNLELFAFVRDHATRRRDRLQFDQYRPYVTMMRARALGLAALARDDHKAALEAIDEGVEGIRAFLEEYDQTDNLAECMELAFLLRWRKEVEKDRPVGLVESIEKQLERAIALEDYEEAARLRDQIRRLTGEPVVDRGASHDG
jgi:tetratricopeptide (TPR) repeat protein